MVTTFNIMAQDKTKVDELASFVKSPVFFIGYSLISFIKDKYSSKNKVLSCLYEYNAKF